jgi:hypothetical protein
VLVGEDAADPHARRQLILGNAYALADQVARRQDAAAAMDVNARMPEHPRGEDWNRDERPIGVEQREHVRRERQLCDVEFPMTQHAEKGLLDRKIQAGQVDAVGSNPLVEEGAGAVVGRARERESERGHGGRE